MSCGGGRWRGRGERRNGGDVDGGSGCGEGRVSGVGGRTGDTTLVQGALAP